MVRRVVLCSGKIYYDLLEQRRAGADAEQGIALMRVEELYPFPTQELAAMLARYAKVDQVFWVQEEAQNMGAWTFVRSYLDEILPDGCELSYIGRDEAASPATGSHHVHQAEQREIVEQALDLRPREVVLSTVRENGRDDVLNKEQASGRI
jgi:2-oxoglutarate dehydrogenase E1 component